LSVFQRKAVPHLQAILNLTIMGMKPSLALEEGDSATIWKRSTQEELKLRHKSIESLTQQNRAR
jgi:hypothetical protein